MMHSINNPIWLFLIAFLVICAALSVSITLSIGPMYWDLYIYFDGVQRIFNGQIPSVDFTTPVGPLNYYLIALTSQVFPSANAYLLVQWSFLFLTMPLMAVVVNGALKRSSLHAWLLTVFFLGYNVISFNIDTILPHTGIEAWGIYNRHAGQLLFVFVAALIYLHPSAIRTMLIIVLLIGLFVTKITGFLAALLILLAFFLAGGMRRLSLLWVLAAVATVLLLSEAMFGFVSGYVADIMGLVDKNQDRLLYRAASVIVTRFDLFLPMSLLALLVFFSERQSFFPLFRAGETGRMMVARVFNTHLFLFLVLVAAGIAFEAQNTGGQPFVFLIPFLLHLLSRIYEAPMLLRASIYLVIALMVVPLIGVTIHKSARAFAGAVLFENVSSENFGTLGLVSARDYALNRARIMSEVYPKHPDTYQEIVDKGTRAGFLLYAIPDFQVLYIQELDRAITAIRDLEEKRGEKFETIWLMDFSNPLAWLMNRNTPRHIPIGIDPKRTLTTLSQQQRQSLAETDLALIPLCPAMENRKAIFDHFSPAFEQYKRISLTPCMDAFVKENQKQDPIPELPNVRVVPLP